MLRNCRAHFSATELVNGHAVISAAIIVPQSCCTSVLLRLRFLSLTGGSAMGLPYSRADIERRALKLILLAGIGSFRARHSPEWCRDKFVGWMRRWLDSMPEPIPTTSGAIPFPDPINAAKAEASHWLRVYCRECGRCDLARR